MTTYEPIAVRSNSHVSLATMSSTGSRRTLQPPRVSMEDYYYNRLLNNSRRPSLASNHFEYPPSYDFAVTGLENLPQRKVKIEPRWNEGHEELPAYSCSITQHAVFLRKMELESAVHKAHDRSWYRVWVELQGTALTFYETKSLGLFSSSKSAPNMTPDQPPFLKRGDQVRTYSLQHADVGIAADYTKRRYVIRVRVETEQFLLYCIEIETFLLWLESLSAAIDLAPPLDDRKLPVDTCMPWIRRWARAPGMNHLEINDNLVRQQQQILTQQCPRLADDTIPEGAVPSAAPTPENRPSTTFSRRGDRSPVMSRRQSMVSTTTIHEGRPALAVLPTNRTSSARPLSPPSDNTMNVPPPATTSLPVTRPNLGPSCSAPSAFQSCLSISSQPNPSISSETGKWQPTHQWSPVYDMMYAKRCMAVLLRQSPRKTNLIIMRGKQWIIDWATGALQRCGPPDYGEVELVGPWGLGPSGQIVRI